MKELQLFQFLLDSETECHFNNDKTEVYAFIHYLDLSDFNKLLGTEITDEEGLSCTFKDGYIVFEMAYICEYFDIVLKNVFTDKIIS